MKLQQNINFLEHELENVKKNCSSSLKTQDYFLKDLENKNNELLSERHIALKNMDLLQVYTNILFFYKLNLYILYLNKAIFSESK